VLVDGALWVLLALFEPAESNRRNLWMKIV